jgi:hypothetical protein
MRIQLAVCAIAALALYGCGKKSEQATSEKGEAGLASAQQVADEARGKVSCPAKVVTQKPSGAPVDDVVGIFPGMGWNEAQNLVLCDNPLLVAKEDKSGGFSIESHGVALRSGFEAHFAEGEKPKYKSVHEAEAALSAQMTARDNGASEDPMKPGYVRYYVGTIGLPNQERVNSVSRQEYFPVGKSPTVQSLRQALVGKYGEPTSSQTEGADLILRWEYDPTGRKITETSPLYNTCRTDVGFKTSMRVTPDCGVTVGVRVTSMSDNAGLAHGISAMSINSAQTYKMVTDTEAALNGADAQRQASELQNAAKAAPAPKI